ncbi:hypothetical protein ACFYO5_37860 [Streptomyces sp. NPDC006259]
MIGERSWKLLLAREFTEEEVNDLLSDEDPDAGGQDDEYEWVR